MAPTKKTPLTKVDETVKGSNVKPFVTFDQGVGGTPEAPAPIINQPPWSRPQRGELPEGYKAPEADAPVEDEAPDPVPAVAPAADAVVTHEASRKRPPV